jgi:hypothetical protein
MAAGALTGPPTRSCVAAAAASRQMFFVITQAQQQLLHIYTLLNLLPERDDGSKAARLARFGAYEVRLVEHGHDAGARRILHVELYDHHGRTVLAGHECRNVLDMDAAITDLISRALRLHEANPGFAIEGRRCFDPGRSDDA